MYLIQNESLERSLLVRNDVHVNVGLESLPVAFLKRGAQLLPGPHLVGVRKALPLRPLVHLVQRLLPFDGRHHLPRQLPADVALAHVAFAVHVGVDADLGASHLKEKVV